MPPPLRRIPHYSAAMSEATRAVIEYLRQMHEKEPVSYAQLSAIAGMDVQKHRGILDTARRYLRRAPYKMLFDVDRNIGFICLPNTEKLGYNDRQIESVHRKARKMGEEIGTVDPAQLSPLEKHRLLCQMTRVAIVAFGTDQRTLPQIEGKPLHERITLNPADYKDLFKGF